MACMGCGSTTPAPKPQLGAAIVRNPTGVPAPNIAKITFGKPKITRGK